MRKGIALAVVLIVIIIVTLLGGVMLYLALRGYRISITEKRITTVQEAAESGIEESILKIEQYSESGQALNDVSINMGKYKAKSKIKPLVSLASAGTGAEFSGGYEPVGGGTSYGGGKVLFIIETHAQKSNSGEKLRIEAIYKKIVGQKD